jgi:hypothetical protein
VVLCSLSNIYWRIGRSLCVYLHGTSDRICGNLVSDQAKATVTKGTVYMEYLIFLYILSDIENRTLLYGVASCIQTVQ